MDIQEMYLQKKKSLDECLALIESNDNIVMAKDCNEPRVFCARLHERAPYVNNVTILKGRSGIYPFLTDPAMKGHFMTYGPFYTSQWDAYSKNGTCSFVPCDLCDTPTWFGGAYPRDVYMSAVTPMDENGNFQVNLSLMWEQAFFDTTKMKKVILEVNPNLKRVRGGLEINIKDVTAFFEATSSVYTISDAPSSEMDTVIGKYVAEMVHDGDCIQLGIGALPNACSRQLIDKHDLGIHTEMFTNLMGWLVEKGVITGARKNINRGEHTFCFADGTLEFYDFLHNNKDVHMYPSSYVTDPFVIRQNDNMVSINSALEVDLTGQVCAETIGTRQYSGPGGAFAFAYGSAHSKGGRSIIIMHSTANNGISKIKSIATPGSVVNLPRCYVDNIVTEYGVARLRGLSVADRTRALISIAHPSVREQLTAEARALNYI